MAIQTIYSLPENSLTVASVHILKSSAQKQNNSLSEKFLWQQLFVNVLLSHMNDENTSFCIFSLRILSACFGYALTLENNSLADIEQGDRSDPLAGRLRSYIRNMKPGKSAGKARKLMLPCFETINKPGVKVEQVVATIKSLCTYLPAVGCTFTVCSLSTSTSGNPFVDCLISMAENYSRIKN
jgi:hypothetical protein